MFAGAVTRTISQPRKTLDPNPTLGLISLLYQIAVLVAATDQSFLGVNLFWVDNVHQLQGVPRFVPGSLETSLNHPVKDAMTRDTYRRSRRTYRTRRVAFG